MTTKPAVSLFQASDNVAKMQASSTLAAMQAAEALRAAGANVVDFGAGEPDFDTPENITSAAAEAMRAGKTKYTSTGGTRELQQAIIDFYARSFGANYERPEVMATSGGKQAVFNAVVSFINPGDEVLLAKPYWVTFPEVVFFARGVPVFIETEETGFVLSAAQVERAITSRDSNGGVSTNHGTRNRPRHLRDLRRVLLALCLFAWSSFQRCQLAVCAARSSLHRWFVFEDICDDRVAYRLRACSARMDS